jgi:hypothetical protein
MLQALTTGLGQRTSAGLSGEGARVRAGPYGPPGAPSLTWNTPQQGLRVEYQPLPTMSIGK